MHPCEQKSGQKFPGQPPTPPRNKGLLRETYGIISGGGVRWGGRLTSHEQCNTCNTVPSRGTNNHTLQMLFSFLLDGGICYFPRFKPKKRAVAWRWPWFTMVTFDPFLSHHPKACHKSQNIFFHQRLTGVERDHHGKNMWINPWFLKKKHVRWPLK